MTRASFIWRNLLRSKRRTALTMISSSVLVLLLAVILALYEAMNAPPSGEGPARRLIVQHATSLAYQLPEAHGKKIREIPGVQVVCGMTWFGGQYGPDAKDPKSWFGRFAIETDTAFECMTEIRLSPEHKKAFVEDRQGAIAGKRTAEKWGWKLGDKIVFQGDYYPCDPELYLRGIFTSSEDPRQEDNLWFHHKYFDELLGRPGKVATFSVLCRSTAGMAQIAQEIDARFANSDPPTRTMSEKEFMLAFIEMIGNVKLIVFSISFAILFVMALVTANTIAMGTRDRVSEAAVMKTLGFLRGEIVWMVLLEAVVISAAGGLLGLAIAYPLVTSISQMGWITDIALNGFVVSSSLLACALVGLLSAGAPAFHLASIRIVDGLRKVG